MGNDPGRRGAPVMNELRQAAVAGFTFAWPVRMDWPLNQNAPKSKAILPCFARSFFAPGSSGTNTPTASMPAVALVEATRDAEAAFDP